MSRNTVKHHAVKHHAVKHHHAQLSEFSGNFSFNQTAHGPEGSATNIVFDPIETAGSNENILMPNAPAELDLLSKNEENTVSDDVLLSRTMPAPEFVTQPDPVVNSNGTPSYDVLRFHAMSALNFITQPVPFANSNDTANDDLLLYHTMPAPDFTTQPDSVVNPNYTPGDPLYSDQWHLDRMGDIETIWDEFTGAGVNVAIYDSGLQYTHPDLDDNYDASMHLVITSPGGGTVDPLSYTTGGNPSIHGTSVAGLIAGENNGEGGTGVAFGSTITGVHIFGGIVNINSGSSSAQARLIEAVEQTANFDIVNHSWGRTPNFTQSSSQLNRDNNFLDAWFGALEQGRDGLGTLQVKAAGNDKLDANGDGLAYTRATIIVGAYDSEGDASYYSNYGANLLISAPSSGTTPDGDLRLVTTDVQGAEGYSPGDYTGTDDTGFGGTSGATPIVAGVIALMLEANPELGWRDVQNILAYSAHEVGSGVDGIPTTDENDVWFYNGADNWNGGGMHFSRDYGFGSVNAFNAVRMAEVWDLFNGPQASANESSYSQSTTTSVELQDLKHNDIYFTFDGPEFDVEFVNVSININHTALVNDLTFQLISPDGTIVTLLDFNGEETSPTVGNLSSGWKGEFGVNAMRGENGTGVWTLRVSDPWFEDTGILNSATITLHGSDSASTADLSNDVYHYTDEVFTSLSRDATRMTLEDSDGGADWLDFAAMSSNLVIRLTDGQSSTANGAAFLSIAAGTQIENAVAGDGNDRLYGNALNNTLYGMRGNDVLDGGIGDDTLNGGQGVDVLIGGIGADSFLFDTAIGAGNVDYIVDFSHIDDTIEIYNSIFSALDVGMLSADVFYVMGSGVEDADDRIVYDSLTGALYYDADGSDAGSAIQFAYLIGGPDDLTFEDFVVFEDTPAVVTTAEDRVAPDAPTTSSTSDPDEIFGVGQSEFFGTEAADTIAGKSSDDTIYGYGGDDILSGNGGNDTIYGGEGQDSIFGGDGDDIIHGGDGIETISGGAGNDTIYLDAGLDLGGGFIIASGTVDGGDGDDIIYGSSEIVALQGLNPLLSEWIVGGKGDDIIIDYGAGAELWGEEGNDYIVGGGGDDMISGGAGDDVIVPGTGFNTVFVGEGFDTVVFESNYADYTIGNLTNQWQVSIERITPGDAERTLLSDADILQFADFTLDLTDAPIIERILNYGELYAIPETGGTGIESLDLPVDVEVDGFTLGVAAAGVQTANIRDVGAENGTEDKLQQVGLVDMTGDAYIQSDALTRLMLERFAGSVTVDAAAGERTLELYLDFTGGSDSFVHALSTELDADEKISDDTATYVKLYNFAESLSLNTAAVNDYNLSFASATGLEIAVEGTNNDDGLLIKWYIPNVTSINAENILIPRFDNSLREADGNIRTLVIETPLDDSILATAGGSAEYDFQGGAHEFIRFGNLGAVNASNDGTTGEGALLNSGLGLRGLIDLGRDDDEAWILGTDAFQGGLLDGGEGGEDAGDVLRMTWRVAEAIGDVSAGIESFEILRLDVPTLSTTVDMANFESMDRVILTGAMSGTGENTLLLVDNSTVTFEETASGGMFGTVHLVGSPTILNIVFTTFADGGGSTGTIHVSDATIVNIETVLGEGEVSSLPFSQSLVLDVANELHLSGEAGWDFTTAGNDILGVTLIDASGVTGSGLVGHVTASATGSDVTFIGGAGDDVFTGGIGNDTLQGGDGADLLDGGLGDDVLDGGDGDADTADYRNFASGVTVDLSNVMEQDTLGAGLDTLSNIERLLGGVGNDTFTGDAKDNLLDGGAGDDAIVGGAGNDTIIGGAGNDLLDGGDGDGDVASYENATSNVAVSLTIAGQQDTLGGGLDTLANFENLRGGSGDDTLTGNDASNILEGGDGSDTLIAAAGNDLLDGGAGTDTLLGGEGDDTYVVDDAGDLVIELDGEGIDTVTSSTISLNVADFANAELFTLTGTEDLNLTGDAADNTLTGNEGDNIIDGGDGDDMLYGNGGDDTLIAGAGVNILDGGDGSDTLVANSDADTLYGGDGLFNGDDIFVLGDTFATVSDGTGISSGDTIVSTITRSLSDYRGLSPDTRTGIEVLRLVGNDAIDGYGSALSGDRIFGNDASNNLDGGLGRGDLHGGGGNDILIGTSEEGRDRLWGGADDDIYYVGADDEGRLDFIYEYDGEGTDTVIASTVSIDLSSLVDDTGFVEGEIARQQGLQELENATLEGAENFDLTGNLYDNVLTGNSGDNAIDGLEGSDTAVFSGNRSDYTITRDDENGPFTIVDNRQDGDGTDTVINVELFQFADIALAEDDLLSGASNSAPEDIVLSGTVIAEFSDDGTVVGDLSASDPDSGETFTYTLLDDANGRFVIDGDKLVVADSAALDFETDVSHDVTVQVTDSGGLTYEKTFVIAVTDVNEKPTVALENMTVSIDENTPTTSRIKVADIVVTDDALGTNRLSLVGRDAALFEIVGAALFIKAGTLLDYEQQQSLEVAVAVDDDDIPGSPEDTSETYTLAVTDLPDENVILGTSGRDYLRGTNDDDHFDGRGGRDTFRGYRGDDTYIVDSSDDRVIEYRGQGTDQVLSSASYRLGSNVENLVLTGDASISGTGNSGDNIIIGNSGNNRLYGSSGSDLIEGGDGNDRMDGGRGTDTVSYEHASASVTVNLAERGTQDTGGAGIDTLSGFENLIGSSFDDTLIGSTSSNVIDGGLGADVMTGGRGNDTYIVDNSGDVVNETRRHGTDTVESSVSYVLGDNIENLTLTGDAAIDGTGNKLGNKIFGNEAGNLLMGLAGNDKIYGGSGDDTIVGGEGRDWLFGGLGNDAFVFNTELSRHNNKDKIADFNVGDDVIHLDNAIFTALFGDEGDVLSADQFHVGSRARDADDHIIYDWRTGTLTYDSNGSARGGETEIAVLSKHLAMTNEDFLIV